MEVRVAGAGLPIVESLRPAGSAVPPPFFGFEALPDDAIAAFAGSLAAGPVRDILQTIEARRFSPEPAVLDHLLQAAISAIAHNDAPGATVALREYMDRDPDHASALLAAPALRPVESQVRELLHRATQEAKNEAEHCFAAAGIATDPDSRAVLVVAGHMIEAGQLAAYIRASELCRGIAARPAARADAIRDARPRRRFRDLSGKVWRRAPLLVMLMGWLVVGMALTLIVGRDNAAAIWGVGFLVLVVLQFLVTTRHY